MKKTCCRCGETKDVCFFPRESRTKDGYHPACKDCRKVIKRQSYIKNKVSILEKQREARRLLQDWVSQFKKHCEKCGESHPACLDFHHDGDKEFGIAEMINRNSLSMKMKQKIAEEIVKCKVLCSNCHRKLHWEERRNCPVRLVA